MFPETITTQYILSQVIGGIALIVVCFGFFLKKDKFLISQIIANFTLAISYLFLNSGVGAVGTFFAGGRCVLFYYFARQDKEVPAWAVSIVTLFFVWSTTAFFKSFYDFFQLGVYLFYTFSFISRDERVIRILLIFATICGVIFNLVLFNYVKVLTSVIELVAVFGALIRINLKRRREIKTLF